MERLIVFVCLFFILNNGCKNKIELAKEDDNIPKVSFISIDVYRNSKECSLSIIYLSESSEIILKPIGRECLLIEIMPPPPPELDIPVGKKIEVERLELFKNEVDTIQNIVEAFKDEDFENVSNFLQTENSIAIEFIMFFSNGETRIFNVINGASTNQKQLIDVIYSLVRGKSVVNNSLLTEYLME